MPLFWDAVCLGTGYVRIRKRNQLWERKMLMYLFVYFGSIPLNACRWWLMDGCVAALPPPPPMTTSLPEIDTIWGDLKPSRGFRNEKAVGLRSHPFKHFSALASRHDVRLLDTAASSPTPTPASHTRPLGPSQRHVSGRDDGQVGPARPAPPAMVYPGVLCHNGRWSL